MIDRNLIRALVLGALALALASCANRPPPGGMSSHDAAVLSQFLQGVK